MVLEGCLAVNPSSKAIPRLAPRVHFIPYSEPEGEEEHKRAWAFSRLPRELELLIYFSLPPKGKLSEKRNFVLRLLNFPRRTVSQPL